MSLKSLFSRRKNNYKCLTGVLVFAMVGLGGGVVFGAADTHAVTGSTINLSISDATLDVDIASVKANGTFAKSNNSTIKVSTDNISGYTLSIAAKGGTSTTYPTALVNTKDSNSRITSITNSLTEDQFKAVGGTDYNGMWGYLPSKYCTSEAASDCSANTAFLPSPTTTAGDNIIDVTEAANSTANEYSLAIGARIDSTVALGSYSNTFVIYATANAVSYSITYDDNVVGNMPTDTSGTTEDSSIALSSNVPTRDGYTFLGWCTVQPTNNNGTDTCSGTTYEAGARVSISGTGGNEYHLYAMWKAAPTATYIQDYTLSQCSTEATDNVTVVDRRDNNEYTVKYINNECWMTQNLRITGTISATDSNFSGSDFNVSAYDLKTNGGSGGQCNGSNGYSAACSRTPDASDLSTIGGTATAESVGAWYNYYAASAGTISGSSNNTAATSDICPAGWHLPTGPNTTSGTDYNKLVGNTTSGWQNPTAGLTAFGAVPGGYYSSGSLRNTGYGYWWSATARNTTNRYSLDYNSSDGQFYGNDNLLRYNGGFVRCVRSS